jgi:hypothetical protein
MPLLKIVTSLIFSNIAIFGPLTASTGPKSSCGPSGVSHEFDRIEQTNKHVWSEKFPILNFMMKTAILKKVKQSENFTVSNIGLQSDF